MNAGVRRDGPAEPRARPDRSGLAPAPARRKAASWRLAIHTQPPVAAGDGPPLSPCGARKNGEDGADTSRVGRWLGLR